MNKNSYFVIPYIRRWPNIIKKRDSKRMRKLKEMRNDKISRPDYYAWFTVDGGGEEINNLKNT